MSGVIVDDLVLQAKQNFNKTHKCDQNRPTSPKMSLTIFLDWFAIH